MSKTHPVPAQFEPSPVAENDKFLVRSETEIFFILRAVMQRSTPVALYFGRGNDFIWTSLLALDREHGEMVMACGANEELSQRELSAEQPIFVTFQNQVKVQFACDNIQPTRFEGRNAFSVNIPSSLLRIQRREYYRVTTPVTDPLKCVIPLPAGHHPGAVELTVSDIGCGGISVIDLDAKINSKPGTLYRKCRIALPEIGAVEVTIEVKSDFEVPPENGRVRKRYGCKFIAVTEKTRAMIQRYVLRFERRKTPDR